MRKCFVLFFLFATAAFAGQPLTILFFNDLHAHLEPRETAEGEVGGIARLAGVANAVRAENEGVSTFLLVAGDVFQGTPFSTVYRGEAEFACLNGLGVSAMCLGNHEYDYGQENLGRRLEEADFPVLGANVTEAGRDEYTTWIEATTWLDAAGKRVLVIGLTTPETPITTAPRNVAGLAFGDPVEAASSLIAEHGDEADVVIAVTHLGFENDLALAEAVPELDVIVGGHTHTKVEGAAIVGDTVVCSAFEYGRYLGRLDLEIEGPHDVKMTGYRLIPITAEAPEDEAVAAVVEKYKSGLSEKLDVVVGTVDTVLRRTSVCEVETNFGDFLADVIREAAAADVAIVNAGGVRADLGPGEITLGDVLTALPFGNEIVVLDVSGATLREAFELCAREKVGEGGFLQVSGCEYKVGPGGVLAAVTVDGVPLEAEGFYKVAMPDFLADGGDGYSMFVGIEAGTNTGLVLYDLVVSALRRGGAVPAEPAGRIEFAGE